MKKNNLIVLLVAAVWCCVVPFLTHAGQVAVDGSQNITHADIESLREKVALLESQVNKNREDGVFNSNLGNAVQVTVMILQLVIFIVGLSQFKDLLKFNRRQKIYEGFMELEREIDETTKDIWGLPENNMFIVDGEERPINLKKISYMVRLIDLYSFERGHAKKYDFSSLKESNALYRMFKNPTYVDYWNHLVKNHFYFESRFCQVIDSTIAEIEKRRL